ncbi:pyridoxamine 5'-phosphate oxidase family protein [Natronomonas gomsonensis]|uniref:pyridoxamine 5'-phosphate oxidase family protein n=1 Tax=Natronomonas gomsonensis TaxID=1046043 RepID=UPI0015BE4C5E|nr:pyridoxamine 5'-phosphate oxidase family protein [Natronomonas gomsonensis]
MTIDELADHGVERMDEETIREFLETQATGVLGLPTERLPYMVPLSYGFDGETNLYFTYVVGNVSQKALLTEETAAASFLVYSADTEYMWSSVSLEGIISRVPEREWDSLGDALEPLQRPEALDDASESEEVAVYRFEIQTQTGIRHAGTPPEMDPDSSET